MADGVVLLIAWARATQESQRPWSSAVALVIKTAIAVRSRALMWFLGTPQEGSGPIMVRRAPLLARHSVLSL